MKLILFCAIAALAHAAAITTSGARFLLDGKPFPYTGVSFFNAIYNAEFNSSQARRLEWLDKFSSYGINVLRVWAQWDNERGFVDSCPACTLYRPDGSLRAEPLARLKAIASDADRRGMVIEFVLFSHESWAEGIRLEDAAAEKAARQLAAELEPHRNVTFQVWNEHSHHTVAIAKAVKAVDPKRLVTSSPGFSGVLTASREETALMDYLSPHTSRQGAGKPWLIAPAEIAYLVARYGKPVVDDEPARNGTSNFGGPKVPTEPYDHIAQILAVWRAGGYPTYHHDMFQLGHGHPSVPPSGIPDPAHSPYHKVVFEFLKHRARYE
ncbi:MAG: hypothetical protein R2729_17670 [Bryobacteraceae bacterium]